MNGIARPDPETDGEMAVAMWDLLEELTGPFPDQGIVYHSALRIHELTTFVNVPEFTSADALIRRLGGTR